MRLPHVRYLLSVSIICLVSGSSVAACSQSNRDRMRSQDAQQSRDFLAIAEFLGDYGYALHRILDQREGHYVAIAASASADTWYLVTLTRESDSFSLLSEPEELFEGYPPSDVEWLSLQGDAVDALRITFDDPIENFVWTEIRRIVDGRLVQSYFDGGSCCKPAHMTDLDADGHRELVTYTEDPTGTACSESCLMALRDEFGFPPAWVRILRWTGEEWTPAESAFGEFYVELAEKYESMSQWIRDREETHVCRRVYWLEENPQIFAQWARRARSIAARQR